jgi:hypothetical protein
MKNTVYVNLCYAVCCMKLFVRYVYRAVKLIRGDQNRLLHCCMASHFVIIIIIIIIIIVKKLAATSCYSASY